MRKSILLFVLFTLTSIPLLLFAQGGYQVTGHIISAEDNQPMIGVSVLEKGTTNGVITDMNGNYSITVTKSPAILQFSYIGMKTMEKQVSAATRIDLKMESDAQMVEEVVVVAYGTRKKGTIAGAVSTVKAEKMENVPAAGFDQSLQGQPLDATSALRRKVSATYLSLSLASGSLRILATCSLCERRNMNDTSRKAALAIAVKPSFSIFRIGFPSNSLTDT